MKRTWFYFILLLGLGLFTFNLSSKVQAHPFNYGAVKTQLKAQNSQLLLQTTTPQKIRFPIPNRVDQKQFFERYFSKNISVKNNNRQCSFKLLVFDNASTKQSNFKGVFKCPETIRSLDDLKIHSSLFNDYFADTDHFVDLSLKDRLLSLVFTQHKLDYPQDVKPVANTSFDRVFAVAKEFIPEGVKHIWTGYDHILFLVSIVLLVQSLKKILILVSAFTVAHSITLILAGLKVVTLSPRIVEPLIALTIIYVATRNAQAILQDKKDVNLGEREVTTAGFGLIHGLGFAGALLAADIPKAYFVPSLLFFNVGVEIGQVGILVLLIPVLIQIRKLRHKREILFAVTVTIIALATFWLLQRVFIN